MATALAASAASPLVGKVVSGITSNGFKNVASGLGSILGSFSHSKGGGIDVAGNKELMAYQMQLNRKQTQWLNENQYKFMRTGLENAGYNPLLALGASPSTGDVGLATGQGNTASTQIGLNDIAGLLNTIAQTKNIESNTVSNELGLLTKFIGTKFGKQVDSYIRKKLSSLANSASSKPSETGSGVFKLYASNLPDDGKDYYFDKKTDYANNVPLPDYLRRHGGF